MGGRNAVLLLALACCVFLSLGSSCGGSTRRDGCSAEGCNGGQGGSGGLDAQADAGADRDSDASGEDADPVDGAPDGQAIDCDTLGCTPGPWCGEECQSECGCCPCQTGEVDADGNRCQDGCWLHTAGNVHCEQPWDAGPCDEEILVYWFDAATHRCEQRVYGGCEGNANRFDSLAFCEQDCAVVPDPSGEPLPVVYEFSDPCGGEALSETERQIVADFVAARPDSPVAAEAPHILVRLMAGNGTCMRIPDVVLTEAGVEAFVDYMEYGEMGYLPAHEQDIPVDAITADLTELAAALGVDQPQVRWR